MSQKVIREVCCNYVSEQKSEDCIYCGFSPDAHEAPSRLLAQRKINARLQEENEKLRVQIVQMRGYDDETARMFETFHTEKTKLLSGLASNASGVYQLAYEIAKRSEVAEGLISVEIRQLDRLLAGALSKQKQGDGSATNVLIHCDGVLPIPKPGETFVATRKDDKGEWIIDNMNIRSVPIAHTLQPNEARVVYMWNEKKECESSETIASTTLLNCPQESDPRLILSVQVRDSNGNPLSVKALRLAAAEVLYNGLWHLGSELHGHTFNIREYKSVPDEKMDGVPDVLKTWADGLVIGPAPLIEVSREAFVATVSKLRGIYSELMKRVKEFIESSPNLHMSVKRRYLENVNLITLGEARCVDVRLIDGEGKALILEYVLALDRGRALRIEVDTDHKKNCSVLTQLAPPTEWWQCLDIASVRQKLDPLIFDSHGLNREKLVSVLYDAVKSNETKSSGVVSSTLELLCEVLRQHKEFESVQVIDDRAGFNNQGDAKLSVWNLMFQVKGYAPENVKIKIPRASQFVHITAV